MATIKKTNNETISNAINKAYLAGNRKMIRLEDMGGDLTSWGIYVNNMEALSNLCRKWLDEYIKADADAKVLGTLEKEIVGIEANMFAWLRTEENSAFFHCNARDAVFLATFALTKSPQSFNIKNVEKFVVPKVFSFARHADFVKRVENYLGNRLNYWQVMSPEKAEFIYNANKKKSKVKGLAKRVESLNKAIGEKDADIKAVSSKAVKDWIKKEKDELVSSLEEVTTKYETSLKEYNAFIAAHPDMEMEEESIVDVMNDVKKTIADNHVDVLTLSVNKMTPAQLKEELGIREIKFSKSAKKSELKKLVKAARKASIEEDAEVETEAEAKKEAVA